MSLTGKALVCHRCGLPFVPLLPKALPGAAPPPPGRPGPLPTCPDCHARKSLARHSATGFYAVAVVFGALRQAHPDWAFHECYHRALHLLRESLDRGLAEAAPVRVILQDPDLPAVAVYLGDQVLGVMMVPGQVPESQT